MLNFYLLGVFVVIVLMIIRIASGIAVSNSLRARNMKKIGVHYNFFAGTFSKEKQKPLSVFFSILFLLIIEPLLSWINVAVTLWKWFSAHANKTAIPESVKEFQFKLAHVDLSKAEIEKSGREMAKLQGVELADDDDDGSNSITEDSNGFFYQHTIYPNKHQLNYYYHSPDYDSESNSIYEYRIAGHKVESRLIERYRSYLPHNEEARQFEVRDNVVLESEIRERHRTDKPLLTKTDEYIEKLKREIEWEELLYYKLKYFVLSKHPEINPTQEYRKFLRSELERIKLGVAKITDIANANGYTVKQFEIGGLAPDIPEELPDSKKQEMKDKYEQIFLQSIYEDNGISENEFSESNDIQAYLLELLGKDKG